MGKRRIPIVPPIENVGDQRMGVGIAIILSEHLLSERLRQIQQTKVQQTPNLRSLVKASTAVLDSLRAT